MLPDGLRSYVAEPAVADPPKRVWRDPLLIVSGVVTAVIETIVRTDRPFADSATGWRIAAVAVFVATMPYALWVRRTRPLRALIVAFVPVLMFGIVARLSSGKPGYAALMISAVALIPAYAVYRWGSGRDGVRAGFVLLGALVVGNLTDAASIGDVIGGAVVLEIPVLAGLSVRFSRSARARAAAEVEARHRESLAHQREELARDLHDTVAHHVSAIIIQAQAGQAVAAANPVGALQVLPRIEEAAARTLEEMRSIVGALRDPGADAEMAPLPGLADLRRLATSHHVGDAHRLDGRQPTKVVVDIDQTIEVPPLVGAALYRIAQEALTNSVRHAVGATRVSIRVERVGVESSVRLEVRDDGRPVTRRSEGGFGLRGMAERAALLGGHVHAGPVGPGVAGWLVEAELPVGARS